jgi:hypothetical protein
MNLWAPPRAVCCGGCCSVAVLSTVRRPIFCGRGRLGVLARAEVGERSTDHDFSGPQIGMAVRSVVETGEHTKNVLEPSSLEPFILKF